MVLILAKHRLRVKDAEKLTLPGKPQTSVTSKKREDKSTLVQKSPLNPNSRLIVRNLPWKIKEDTLLSLFSPHATVEEIIIPRNPNGQLKGFAFVQCKDIADANKVFLI
jgi:nucleolar protein 4